MVQRLRFVLLLTSVLAALSCASGAPLPAYAPLAEAAVRRPVVLVPGITGAKLRDAGTGKLAWGSGARLVSPRDGAYGLARSLNDPAAAAELEPDGVLEVIRLAFVKKDVYGPIARLLEQHGYRRGDLADPRPGDTLFLFAYDWRQDNEAAIGKLYRELQELRRVRGDERLEVDLVCQSNGAHICRYLVKYGGATFSEAAAGRGGLPESLEVRKVILVGSSNGGSLRILSMLDRGRRYVPLGRKFQPEVLFTFPSLFQDLPSYRDRYFLGPDGQELAVDLYDAEAWEEHGWSIFGGAARRRASRRPDLFGSPEQWRAYLAETLERARLFQQLLASDPPAYGTPRYYLIQNPSDPTPERAVLERQGGEWELLFTGDRELGRRPGLRERASALGDGHASVASQVHLSPRETAAIAAEPVHVAGDHFELILNPESLRRLLELLHGGGD